MEQNSNNATNTRNMVLTPHASQCRICHYSGVSNICEFFSTSKCPFLTTLKEVRKTNIDMTYPQW